MPLGPSDVFMRLATVRAAVMLISQLEGSYLVGFKSLNALLFLLLSEDNERAA
jgi:hypothetical protein